MTDPILNSELNERLALIETMIAQGRRTTERWGWCFVVWGVAYYVAFAWSYWGQSAKAWPVTMIVTGSLVAATVGLRMNHRPSTAISRSIGSLWYATCVTFFILFPALSSNGHLVNEQVFLAISSALLGLANAASGMILRWKVQLICGILWWFTAALSCWLNAPYARIAFLIAIFLCLIVFGVYGMIREARACKSSETRHG